jgi:hypothetical protein
VVPIELIMSRLKPYRSQKDARYVTLRKGFKRKVAKHWATLRQSQTLLECTLQISNNHENAAKRLTLSALHVSCATSPAVHVHAFVGGSVQPCATVAEGHPRNKKPQVNQTKA